VPFHTNNTVTGIIQTDNGLRLGQVFFKDNQWVCSYGVKRFLGLSESQAVYIYLFGGSDGGSVMLCDYQVVKFRSFYEANSFLNSRAFAENAPSCREIPPPQQG
jgi:hypothetical protein